MASPEQIMFKGIPRSPTRGYTARVIAAVKPEQVVIPCTGSFSLAYVAAVGGAAASKIYCGDISLYSTAIGNAIMDREWRLEVKDTPTPNPSPKMGEGNRGEIVKPYLTDPMTKAAAVLFMVRVCQYDGDKLIKQDFQRELLTYADSYILQLKAQIEQYRELLGGLTYVAQDMWVTLEETMHNPKALLLVNPPRYTGGYDRMFKGIDEIFDWDEPTATQFTEKDYPRLMNMLGDEPSHTLLYYATQGEDPAPMWGHPWKSVFADMPAAKGRAAINWIVANRDPIGVDASRAKITQGKAKYKLFDGIISPTPNPSPIKGEGNKKSDPASRRPHPPSPSPQAERGSLIKAVRVDKDTGDYYRDLFIHKLPGSVTEVYVTLLIDGMLSGIIGLHLADLRRGKVVKKGERVLDHCASVTFAFTVPHEKYGRLHKLTLMSIVSEWFWVDVLGQENWFSINGAPKNVKTVMLTPHPENKTARGILKLDDREQQPDGSYKLYYSAPTVQRSAADTIGEWVRKFAVK